MRRIIAYKHYYREFMEKLSQQERDKIKRALLLFETEDRIPRHYISYIRDGVYELRTKHGKSITLRYFWMQERMRVLPSRNWQKE